MLISRNHISIRHIMWQPIFQCSLDCDQCYVSKSESSKVIEPSGELIRLIKSNKISCSQLTISLDTTKHPSLKLVDIYKEVWDFYSQNDRCECPDITSFYWKGTKTKLPELCITAHNWSTIQHWANYLNVSIEKFLEPLSLLSLSQFPYSQTNCKKISELCKDSKTVLNFNKMIDQDPLKDLNFWNGILYADQVYLVLKKSSLGSMQQKEDGTNWLKAYKLLKETLDSSSFQVIKLDSCVIDSQVFNRTGNTCGAGINKIHVWPGDTVTGCPYDSHNILNGHALNKKKDKNLFQEIAFAIYDRKPDHSMRYCTIPKEF